MQDFSRYSLIESIAFGTTMAGFMCMLHGLPKVVDAFAGIYERKWRKPSLLSEEQQESINKIHKSAIIFLAGFVLALSGVFTIFYLTHQRFEKAYDAREREAIKRFGFDIMQLNYRDPRPKLIYFVGQDEISPSNQGKLNIQENPSSGNWEIIETLNKTHDVYYKAIHDPSEICTTIDIRNIHQIQSIIIDSQAGPHSILSSSDFIKHNFLKGNSSDSPMIERTCFSRMNPNGEIILLGNETGKPESGIASTLSNISRRVVWAPIGKLRDPFVQFSAGSSLIPKFYGKPDIGLLDENDIACKFSFDGSYTCPSWYKVMNSVYNTLFYLSSET
jgi:hypothetical protein